MKSTLENVSSLERRLNIEVPAEVVTGAFDRVFRSIQKDAQIKGFRQGKAPLATIKSVYGDRVKQDVLQEVLQNAFFQAIQENKVNPVSSPEFEFTLQQLNEGQNFAFTANFEVRPEIILKNYEGLAIELEKFEVDEKRIDAVIDNIRNAHAEWIDLLELRPAQLEDMAKMDFVGKVNGELLENGSGHDFELELGSGRFIPGFEEGIVGMKVADTKTVSLKFPDNYHVADLAGRPVDFQVTLKSLKKKSLPELTPEFLAGKMGPGIDSPEALRENVRKDLVETEKKRIDSDLKNRLLRALVRANPTDVPPSLLKEQKAALVEDMKKRLTQQGLNEDDFAAYTDKWDADFDTTAREMIQSGYLVDAIATQHELSFNDEDLEKKYAEYAQQTGIELARIRDFYSRPEQVQRLTYMITEEKVIEFLMKTAKVTEVKKENLKEKN
jgi:trigger factor